MTAKRSSPQSGGHKWEFKARFRRHSFGWRSQPAITRIREAVAEIRSVARTEPLTAADGAVALLERLSPALEQVDGSSGAIGGAVNRAIAELVPLIAKAPADAQTRNGWLERLFQALQDDQMPYIEMLGDHWGELCASKELASAWGDRLVGITRMALSPDPKLRGHFPGTSACLSALYRAERYDELIDVLRSDALWHYKQWAVRALAATGRKAEALRYAESCRSPWAHDQQIDSICEEILLSSGLVDEAYTRYGLRANRRATYLGTYRAVVAKYPHRAPAEILADLVATTPGEEGKWFAAAKDAGLYTAAIELARRTPCDPRTLARAARDFAGKEPGFAVAAGLLALHWLVRGHGYEITSADVLDAYRFTLAAAEPQGRSAEVREQAREIVLSGGPAAGFVEGVLGSDLGL